MSPRGPWVAAVVLLSAGPRARVRVRADTPPNAWDVAKDPRCTRSAGRSTCASSGCSRPRVRTTTPSPIRASTPSSGWRPPARCSSRPTPRTAPTFAFGSTWASSTTSSATGRAGASISSRRPSTSSLPPSKRLPTTRRRPEALSTLVYAYAKMNRPREELATWHRYIPRLVDDGARVVAMMNMGEAEMRLGQRRRRARDVPRGHAPVRRRCPNTSGIGSTYVLALWDIAVALDRSGRSGTARSRRRRGRARMSVIGSRGTITGAALIERRPGASSSCPSGSGSGTWRSLASAEARDAKDPREALAFWTRAEQALGHVRRARAAADGTQDTFLPDRPRAPARRSTQGGSASAAAAQAPEAPPGARARSAFALELDP